MNAHHSKGLKVFSGNANKALAAEIAAELGGKLGECEVRKFSDGETSVCITETVRGYDVFIVQSTCAPTNDNLMELLILCDACRRASAGSITAVIPYYGYARQDRKINPRDPITAKLVANLICTAGADRVLTMDLHASQEQAYFDVPVDELHGMRVLTEHYLNSGFASDDLVVVSPDLGSVTRARNFAGRLNAPLAIIDKRRPRPNVCEVVNIIGDVRDKRVLIVDDMIDTAGTICNAARALMDSGAKEVYACCTHGVLSGPALARIQDSPIKELICTNTIPLPEGGESARIRQLSVAKVFAAAMRCIAEEKPLTENGL